MSYKEIFFPPRFTADTVHVLLNNVFGVYSLLPNVIIFNFKDLNFIDPVGVTALANITLYSVKHGVQVFYRRPDFTSQPLPSCYNALKYLDDAGFFQRFLNESLFPNPCCRSTTMPLRNIKCDEYHFWTEHIVIPWLDSRLAVDIKWQMPELSVCLDEIFNNVDDHSGEREACVFMQHFPASNIVHIAISDFGVGIPHNVKPFLGYEVSDAEAILKAMEDGFSTKSTPQNRGAGLDNLIQNVVHNNKGELTIFSGEGIVKCRKMGKRLSKSERYPGTLIDIRLRTDTLPSEEDAREVFIW